jgi:hypothetical protein
MSDLLKRLQSNRGSGPIEWLMRKLPGFKGYEDMQERRLADQMLRAHIVALLKAELQNLITAEKAVLNGGGLSYMSKMKDAKSKYQTFINRVDTAMPGYSGFFAKDKVGPAELQLIYNFDADVLDLVDQFKAKVTDVKTAADSKEGLDKAINEFEALATEANNIYGQRENVLARV